MSLGMTILIHPDATSVDVSQMPARLPMGFEDLYPTFTPKMKLIDLLRDRYIWGIERLFMHGFPMAKLREMRAAGFSDALMADLAGNSFVGMIFAALLIGLLLYLPDDALKTLSLPESEEHCEDSQASQAPAPGGQTLNAVCDILGILISER